MKKFLLLICLFIVFGVVNDSYAQSFASKKKVAEQRANEKKRVETERYNDIIDEWDLYEYQEFISDYPKSKNLPEIKARIAEINLWENASDTNTLEAYKNYLATSKYRIYEDEANESINEILRIMEREAWNSVLNQNTIEAYQDFISNNPNTPYRDEALKQISILESINKWQSIKNSNDISVFQQFIAEYPNSEFNDAANVRINILQARNYYNKGNLEEAYSLLSKLDSDDLSPSDLEILAKGKEYNIYSSLSANSSVSTLENFLKAYPYSEYTNNVKNYIALNKAQNFSDYASESSYQSALNYATDAHTRTQVQSYIDENKRRQKERAKRLKQMERRENGGLINIGVELVDYNWNCLTDDDMVQNYNFGVWARIGNYRDVVQFAIGVKPGLVIYKPYGYAEYNGNNGFNDYYDYSEDSNKVKFHMPISAQLKLSPFKSNGSKFFVFGQIDYNALRIKEVESSANWRAGLGWAGKHCDWNLYYSRGLGEVNALGKSITQQYVGTSLTFYWMAY